MPKIPAANLAPVSTPWGRWVEGSIQADESAISRAQGDISNLQRTLAQVAQNVAASATPGDVGTRMLRDFSNRTTSLTLDGTADSGSRVAMTPAERTKLAGQRADSVTDANIATAVANRMLSDFSNRTVALTLDGTADSSTRIAMQPSERSKLAALRTDASTDALLASKADLVGGLVPTSQLPAIALTNVITVASQSAMLALTSSQIQPGDVAVRTDGAGTFMLSANPPSVLSNWVLLNAPADKVSSVNGQIGTVVLGKGDVGLGNADDTSDVNKPVSTAQAAAIAVAHDDSMRRDLSNSQNWGAPQNAGGQFIYNIASYPTDNDDHVPSTGTVRYIAASRSFLSDHVFANVDRPNQWLRLRYSVPPTANIAPSYAQILQMAPADIAIVNDGASLAENIGDEYIGVLRAIIDTTAGSLTFTATHDDAGAIFIDGVAVWSSTVYTANDTITFNVSAGRHTIDLLWNEEAGGDGWNGISPAIGSLVVGLYAPTTLYAGEVGRTAINDGAISDSKVADGLNAQKLANRQAVPFSDFGAAGTDVDMTGHSLLNVYQAPLGDNTGRAASTAFVAAMRSDLTGAAPSNLNTLAELATAVGNDPIFSANVNTALANRMLRDFSNATTVIPEGVLPERLHAYSSDISTKWDTTQVGSYHVNLSTGSPYGDDRWWYLTVENLGTDVWVHQTATMIWAPFEQWERWKTDTGDSVGTWSPWQRKYTSLAEVRSVIDIPGAVDYRLGERAHQITDWNEAITNGWWMGEPGTLNSPDSNNWGIGEVVAHNPGWTTQTVWDFTNDSESASQRHRRQQNDGVWGDWYALVDTRAEIQAMITTAHDDSMRRDFSNASNAIPDSILPPRIQPLARNISNGDANLDALDSGWTRGYNVSNAPGTGWYYFWTVAHDGGTGWHMQYAYGFGSGAGDDFVWMRKWASGTWSAWRREDSAYSRDFANGTGKITDGQLESTFLRADFTGNTVSRIPDSWLPDKVSGARIIPTPGADLNSVVTTGTYAADGTGGSAVANAPTTGNVFWVIEVISDSSGAFVIQKARDSNSFATWERFYNAGVWSAWIDSVWVGGVTGDGAMRGGLKSFVTNIDGRNLNDSTYTTGWYYGTGMVNAPTADPYYVEMNIVSVNVGKQMATTLGGVSYTRTKYDAGGGWIWSDWVSSAAAAAIPDGSITNAKVATGAAISLDKTIDSTTRATISQAERTRLAALTQYTDAAARAAAQTDAVAGTASLRTLGTGSQQAAAGNDSRLTDQRTPTDASVTNAKVASAAGITLDKTADSATGGGRLAMTTAERTKLTALDTTHEVGTRQTYTPVMTSDGSGTPAVGNGSIGGEYIVMGANLIWIKIYFTAGSTSSGGNGNLYFSLPSGITFAGTGEQWIPSKLYSASAGANFMGFAGGGAADTRFTVRFPNSNSDVRMGQFRNADATNASGTSVPQVSGNYVLTSGSNFTIEGMIRVV